MLPVALLAGGLATRLKPITETIPKLLVPVADEPFFCHQLRLLKHAGFTRIVLCVGHLGEKIVARFGNGRDWGVQLEYSFDGPALLGTGGALIRALPLLGERFVVLYGDSYLPVDYAAAINAFLLSGKAGLMTVFRNENNYDLSNVWFEDGRIVDYDKTSRSPHMRHIDYGLNAFEARVFTGLARDRKIDLADVQRTLVRQDLLFGYEVFERFYEIGSHTGLQELDAKLRRSAPA